MADEIQKSQNTIKDDPELEALKKKYAELSQTNYKLRQSRIGKILIPKGQNKRYFEKMRLEVLQELRPASKIENILVEKFICAVFNHERGVESLKFLLTQQNYNQYVRELKAKDPDGHYIGYHHLEKWSGRMRTIKNMDFSDPQIQSVIKYIIAQEKSLIKLLKQIRAEQALRNPQNPIVNSQK
jgi:uncharacterized short protein YbdD (DUF466 family)